MKSKGVFSGIPEIAGVGVGVGWTLEKGAPFAAHARETMTSAVSFVRGIPTVLEWEALVILAMIFLPPVVVYRRRRAARAAAAAAAAALRA